MGINQLEKIAQADQTLAGLANEHVRISSLARQRIEAAWACVGRRVETANLDVFSARRVAIIAGSSRGGTSLVHALLCRHPDTVSLDGEHTPYYKALDFCFPFLASDAVAADLLIDKRALSRLFMSSLATPCESPDLGDWIDRWLLRLPLQFDCEFDFKALRDRLFQDGDLNQLKARVFEFLHSIKVNVSFYDREPFCYENGPITDPQRHFGILEETPYVFPEPRKTAISPEDLREKVLVLKSSVDAHRLAWLCKLFSRSEITILHLTRNPAASINGLIDGWQTLRGFYAHNLGSLHIRGYSEAHERHEELWCFDLPENWRDYTDAPLGTVCANQWQSAHRGILAGLGKTRSLRVKFEHVILNLESRVQLMEKVRRFLGLSNQNGWFKESIQHMPVVMRTVLPEKSRWRKREPAIRDALLSVDRALVKELYRGEEEWI